MVLFLFYSVFITDSITQQEIFITDLQKPKPFVSIDIVIVYILGLLLLLFVLLLLTLQLLNSFLTLVVVKEGVLRFLGNRLTSGKTTSRRPLFPRG